MGGVFAVWIAVVLVGATRSWSHPFSGPLSQAVTLPVVAVLIVLVSAALVTVPTRGTTITGHLPTGSSPAPMIKP